MKPKIFTLAALMFLSATIVFVSCKKESATPADPCNSDVFTFSSTSTPSTVCSGTGNGSITVTVTGGTGLNYRLNTGTYQSTPTFSNLAAGSYSVWVKNAGGCEKSAVVTVASQASTLSVSATTTSVPACASTGGGITATASGGGGSYTYKLGSAGTYQASGTFSNLAAGAYTVYAKDALGCEQSTNVSVSVATATPGPLFTAVKNLMTTKCFGCHNNTTQNGGMNWTIDCNIVTYKDRIKARAVDLGTMPPTGPLSASEKAIITNWYNAGGKITD